MSCPPYYYLSESCVPSLVSKEYKPAYYNGKFKGRVLMFKRARGHRLRKVKKKDYAKNVEKRVANSVKKGLNIRLISYFTPEEIFYSKKFKGMITQAGGMLSHAAILAREQGIPFCVLPNATNSFYQGDYVRLKNGMIKRKESDFFTVVTPLPDSYSLFGIGDYYQTVSRKALCELAGRKTKIIEPVRGMYSLNLKPSEYYSLVKKIDTNSLIKTMKKVKGLKKVLLYRLMQETSINFSPEKVRYYFKADKAEDKEWERIRKKILLEIKETKSREKKKEKIKEAKRSLRREAEELVRIIEKA